MPPGSFSGDTTAPRRTALVPYCTSLAVEIETLRVLVCDFRANDRKDQRRVVVTTTEFHRSGVRVQPEVFPLLFAILNLAASDRCRPCPRMLVGVR